MEKIKKLKKFRNIGVILIVIDIIAFAGAVYSMMYISNTSVSVVLFVVSLILWIPGLMLFLPSKSKLRGLCMNCGSSMVGCEYEYDETGRQTDDNGNASVTIVYEAECPNCASVKKFYKKFSLSYGTNTERNVRKYAEKYFGK